MNDEDAFQAALDAHPDDHVTRLVFADWLEERGDPRAEGYRALGRLRLWPLFTPSEAPVCWRYTESPDERPREWAGLPWSWHQWWRWEIGGRSRCGERAASENAAALAFLRLSPARRAELLSLSAA